MRTRQARSTRRKGPAVRSLTFRERCPQILIVAAVVSLGAARRLDSCRRPPSLLATLPRRANHGLGQGRAFADRPEPEFLIDGSPGDADHLAVAARAVEVMTTVMAGYGLHGDDAIDAVRAFRSALHGFVSLEAGAGFGMPLSVDRSFDRLVRALVTAVATWSAASEPGRGVPAG